MDNEGNPNELAENKIEVTDKKENDESPKSKVSEGKNDVKTEMVQVRPPREVKAIQSMSQVPNKFKDEKFSLSDLVAYNGGNKVLEKELWENLKGKIKDTDIPKSNSSIVFKFTVTSKGKVKDVNIQSLVTVELEELIKQTTLNLNSWNKGKKRIPMDYTVYVTFK